MCSRAWTPARTLPGRYDTKQDYVTTGGTFPSCQQAYLGEAATSRKYRRSAKQSSGALIDDEPHDEYRIEFQNWTASACGSPRRRAALGKATMRNWVDGR